MPDLSPAQERAVRLALKLAHTNTEMRAMTDRHENQIATLTAELAEVNRKLAAVEAVVDEADTWNISSPTKARLLAALGGDHENQIATLTAELAEANRKLAAVEARADQWEDEIDEQARSREFGIAEGLRVAMQDVRAALGGDHD